MSDEGTLFARVASFRNLLEAARLTLRGQKRKAPAARFWFDLEPEILQLEHELKYGEWRPRPYRLFTIYEFKPRLICASNLRDRVVHHAICRVLDPLFESRMIQETFACRVGKGSHAAVRRAQEMMRRSRFFLQCDVSKYFASIDHDVLKGIYRQIVGEKRLLMLLDQVVDHAVPGYELGKGLPIGNLTSQYFANLYLGEWDSYVTSHLPVNGYLRYMDDWLVFCDDKAELHRVLAETRGFLADRLRLRLKEKAIRIAPVSEGVTFLGFQIYPGMVRLCRGRLARVRRTIRWLENRYMAGEIGEEELSRSVSSMLGHWRQANTLAARRKMIDRLTIRG